MTLHIALGLELADDLVTKTVGILAQRRKGKTYTASVIAEELVDNSIPFVALDPTSAWWGLRASADGAPRLIFDAVVDAWPAKLDADRLCEIAGVDPAKSTYRNAMSRLRTLGLVNGNALDDDLAEAIR